jgi:hypothetical protein
MLLIRHNRLLPPYHDYAALDVGALDALAAGRVSPSVGPLPEDLGWGPDVVARFMAADEIVCSTAARTQETSALLLLHFGLEKPVGIDGDLDEILFTPSLLMRDPADNPLAAVRAGLFPALLNGGAGAEKLEAVQARAERLAATYRGRNAVLLSHGFFMQYLRDHHAPAAAAGGGTIGYLQPMIWQGG